jgi:Cytochrome C oxidase, cbb3-type, subunit III
VLKGVYTAEQAARGQAAYAESCARCHGANLEGFSAPPLKGAQFMDRWREFPLKVAYDIVANTMPFGAPASLGEKRYLDIMARILEANEIPAGARELATAMLGATLVGKNGPQPLPSSSPVETVGCMRLDVGNGWFVDGASEPSRTLDPWELTPPELATAKSRAFGTQLYRLVDLVDGPKFNINASVGTKISVKGILVRQAGNPRINVTTIQSVAPNCDATQ